MTTPDPQPVTPDVTGAPLIMPQDEFGAARAVAAKLMGGPRQFVTGALGAVYGRSPRYDPQTRRYDREPTPEEVADSTLSVVFRAEDGYNSIRGATIAEVADVICEALEAAVAPAAGSGSDDASRDLTTRHGQARDDAGASPALPVGADFDREAEYWHGRWLFAWERLDEAGGQAISQHVRIMELEGKLAEVRELCEEAGTRLGGRILAIIGTGPEDRSDEGEARDA
jgi:hypothetical protein